MMKSILLFAAMMAAASAQTCKCGGRDVTAAMKAQVKMSKTIGIDLDFCGACELTNAASASLPDGDAKDALTCVCTSGCFPATAEIELSSGMKQVGSIAVGDKVHVGSLQYSDVYYFSTAMEDSMSKFVSLATVDTKKPLLLTSGHYLYVNGKLQTAGSVKVGDLLTLANGDKSAVTDVSSQWAPGLYNPHTLTGDIVVDGILTSTYTDEVSPLLAHALLGPLRQMYAAGATMGQGFSVFAKGVPRWIRNALSTK